MKFECGPVRSRIARGFSLLEAMVSVALIGIAMVATFSVIKVVSQGKSGLDDRTNFYLASLSFGSNLGVAMMETLGSDAVDISINEIFFSVNGACPSTAAMTPFKARVQTELCKTKFMTLSQSSLAIKNYKLQVTNKKTPNGSTNHLAFKLAFIDPTTNAIVFERMFLYVK